ncbi:polyprenyl synthetase family protein [Microbispora sp. NEAU-D428]|uniref:polyprenyl synthetase family protein n=1 Tax=Microbispora sitophila TaxID=2771537 RepID=UPI00186621AC|nr:polyprenyl synthetase family protein [Microbispora sitophila]MBE3009070.1 polyprenyl synthetase family protein [Microbispora sitophila]
MTTESPFFPALISDLERVREVLGLAGVRGRPDLATLTRQPRGGHGRLIRPTLALLSYYLFAGPEGAADVRAVRAAAAVELLHTASLYHDDVIDDARQRRGRPSVNGVWGARMAVLAGDLLVVNASRILAELGEREALVAAEAGERACSGVIAETADRFLLSRTEEAYMEVTGAKTAELLSVACRLGAMQAAPGSEGEEALARFGWHLGLAYQVRDDILDLTATAGNLGKPANSDIVEGVYTLPVIRALAREPVLARLLRRGLTAAEAESARRLVLSCGAVDEARQVVDAHMEAALRQLDGLGDPRPREALAGYARSVMSTGKRPGPAPVTVPAPSPAPAGVPARVRDGVQERVDAWLLETGLAATPEEVRHPRWSGMASAAARMWPGADPEQVETLARWILVCYVLDDLLEDPALTDPEEVIQLRHRLTLLIRDLGDTPRAGGAVATALAQSWARIRLIQPPSWQARALDHLAEWLEACEREACHRLSGFVPSLRDQLPLRLRSAGPDLALDLFEVTYGRQIDPVVRDHPLFRRALDLGLTVVLAENDLRTLEQDEAAGAPYNLVRVLCHETGCTRQEAIDEVTRQVEDGYAQLDAMLAAAPALLRAPGGAARGTDIDLVHLVRERVPNWRSLYGTGRYSRTPTGSGPDLARLRRELLLDHAETGVAR